MGCAWLGWLDRRAALALFGCVLVVGCKPAEAKAPDPSGPARVENVPGSDQKRVTLTAEAAERIGIRTAPVREQQITRKRMVGGEVIATDAGPIILVRATPGDVVSVDKAQAARVQPLIARDRVRAPATPGSTARVIVATPTQAPEGIPNRSTGALYYAIDANSGLAPGQRVLVELVLSGGVELRKVVPYSAVLYDLKGETWTYTRSAQLSFVRQRIGVDYIEGDLAVLWHGPPVGTDIVTVGAMELFGAESRVGK